MARTIPATKQVLIGEFPVHLGEAMPEESSVGVRITVPSDAAGYVWIGSEDVTADPGDRPGERLSPGSSVRLPSTSFQGWYAVTDGATVFVTLAIALGGNSSTPEWGNAGGGGVLGSVTAPANVIVTNTVTTTPAVTSNILPALTADAGFTRIVPTDQQPMAQSISVTMANDQTEIPIVGITTIQTRARNATDAGFPTSRVIDANVRALDVTAVGGATEAKQDVGNTSLSTIVTRLPPALGPGGGLKTDDTLGSGLGVVRGNATTVSTALPAASYQFGFVFKNMSPTLTIWIKQGTVTMADGYPLGPGDRLHLSLPNPSILHVVTSAGSAPFAIAAVTP